MPAAERNIGMVFQNYALFPHMTIAENIAYGLKVRKVAKAGAGRASVARVAELMALGELLDRKPAQLSGGQQQRVALARVLVSERPLVLMDEPLSNLDAKLRSEIRSEIRALNKKLGHHRRLRDPRPERGAVDVRQGRADECGSRSHRSARRKELYDAPGKHLCGELHRHTADEPAGGRRCRRCPTGFAASERATRPTIC